MDYYIYNVINKSKFGYFYMNLWDKDRKNNLLIKLNKHYSLIKEFKEVPKTSGNPNYLWVCYK
jgi:hypothetical protein